MAGTGGEIGAPSPDFFLFCLPTEVGQDPTYFADARRTEIPAGFFPGPIDVS